MPDLSPIQADALRELCNICGGYAATALSKLLGNVRVDIDLPEVEHLPLAQILKLLGDGDHEVVAAQVQLQGPLNGELLLALSGVDADQLAAAVGQPLGESELSRSVFREAANIVASACLNALYGLTHLTVMPGVPHLVRGLAATVLPTVMKAREGNAVVLSTELRVARFPLRARLVVVPDAASLSGLLVAMGVAA